MNFIIRPLIALLLVAIPVTVAPAQNPLPRGPRHDTSAAREALLKRVPDIGERDVLLITLDSVALDLLPIYGSGGPPMPNFEAFSNESILFLDPWAASPNRLSAAIAVHHSLYPSTAVLLGSTEKSDSLASRLADSGFTPYGIVRPDFFETDENVGEIATSFDIEQRRISRTRNPATILDRFRLRLSERRSAERLFGWIHLDLTWPPATYHPGFEASGSFENHYRAALQSVDAFLGQVALALAEEKAAERTIVVLTGLHGLEGLDGISTGARGIRQETLDAASLRVPLVIHVTGLEPERIAAPVSTLDIAPTILDLMSLSVGDSCQGRSLLDLMIDARARENRTNLVFAELLERKGEPRTMRAQFVFDERWSLAIGTDDEGGVMVDAQEPRAQSVNELTAAAQNEFARLKRDVDDLRIYTETCAEVWDRGIFEPIALDEPLGELGRARFLARRRQKDEAAAVIARLISREGDHLETALTVAIENEIALEGMGAKELLQHSKARVRGLAGAWLAIDGRSEAGLDQAIALLGSTEDRQLLGTLLLALGQSGSPRALEAIRALDSRDDELAARRDLALVRLGDAEAVGRLPRRFLTPQAGYDRLPFFDAIAEKMPERLVGLGRLYLEDGDGNPRLVRAVLERLEKLNAVEAAPSLALALGKLDTELRDEVVAQLERWKSLTAARAAVALAKRSAVDADFAARVLLEQPGLLSSPYVPSLRMDHLCSRFEDPKMRRLDQGASLGTGSSVEFTLVLEGTRDGHAVVIFQVSKGPAELEPDAIRFELRFNESRTWLRTESLERHGDLWVWVGRLRAETLEAGQNKVQMRLRHRDREPIEAQALAFVVLPDQPIERFMIAGLDSQPLRGEPVTRSGGKPAGDAGSYEIFMRRDPFAEIAGEIRVLADGKTFARFALRDFAVPRRLEIALPDWAGPESLLELQAVDVPAASGLSAILYGRRATPAPRARRNR